MTNHEIKLTKPSLYLLRTLLNQPEWAKTIQEFTAAGQLLASTFVEPDKEEEHYEYTVNDKQRDVIRAALTTQFKRVNPSPASLALYQQFGVE